MRELCSDRTKKEEGVERSYYLVTVKEGDQGSLKLLSLNPHLIFEDVTQFDSQPIGENVPMEGSGVYVRNRYKTPKAIIDTMERLIQPQKLDANRITQITMFFSTPSEGVCVTPEELRKFLNANIGHFIICIGVG
jgi:hypothetical protein